MAQRKVSQWKRVAPGAFAGKNITIASTEEVDAYDGLVAEFMSTVFNLDVGDYAISDESHVFDFTPLDERDTSGAWRRIEQAYGVVQADVESEHLVNIFRAINGKRGTQ